jgi:hypothetical protein
MEDKTSEILAEALKQALAEPGEQRLYKSGKLPGLFAGRLGSNAEAAARALRDGLLEITRTETKGKITAEWVRPTPRATEFVYEHESPVRALKDLQAVLQVTREGIPLWLSELRQQTQALVKQLSDEAERWTHRLDALSRQVEGALRRVEAKDPELPEGVGEETPWAAAALTYLDQRRKTSANGPCTLPELFGALRDRHPDLTVSAFRERLRRLHDRRIVRLLPFNGLPENLPEPEWAMIEGSEVLYCVTR